MPSRGMPFTEKLAAASTPRAVDSQIPCYQVMDSDGKVIDPSQDPLVRREREEGKREREREREREAVVGVMEKEEGKRETATVYIIAC